MKRLSRHLALLLAGLAPALAGADEPAPASAPAAGIALRPYAVVYEFNAYGFSAGTVGLTLRQETPQEWTYVSKSQPRGLFQLVRSASRTVTSRMIIDQRGVRPLLSTDTEDGERAPQSEVHFDWTANRAIGQVEGQAIDMELRPGVQDDLSAQVALIQALNTGQAPSNLLVFDKSGIRDYSYTRVGEEKLSTPLGEVATIIYRSQRANAPRSTRYWCAPALGYIPVRVEQRRLDKVEWTMNLRNLHRDLPPAAPALP
ncbi:MAG TPA: DUF3108 domain-containing protein [Steroidobacteraceae bacterium]|nr:DUF3108 domain-containing protein [Steroidobacteraceae bacterium]